MKNIIKRGLILLLISLCLPTPSISQTTSADTLKAISLIFNEHEKLSIENPLLKEQVASLEKLNQLYVQTDSIKNKEINLYKEKVASDEKKIQRLKSTQKKLVVGSSVGGIVLFILGLLILHLIFITELFERP